MKVPWHRVNPATLTCLEADLAHKYPDLRVICVEDCIVLRGSFPIFHGGAELDRFQIEVIILPTFPEEIPVVRETAGRVPHTSDWHTYRKGALCVIVPEEWLLNPQANSVLAFLDGPLRNFFIAHALAEAGQQRPMGERPHGSPGLLEAYGELVGSSDRVSTKAYLTYLAKGAAKGHWPCPCGSGKRLRNCHSESFKQLKNRFPAWVAQKALKRLADQMETERAELGL